ncbi:MAG TPA: hexitol phosphatase HxpB [Porphyromonadaceae bacterium]|jgi:sugar-phosphatase|uniref:hexitol phosphatase HxpB n=1 Tax=Limibacterium fermenti TaxID=3229863 RepID=UPI000E91E10A|nr:hexitol phosphatase HxpB [Porphyromonadaceae bacterium]HBK31297.1 hexitol phosphatase HxpB [Porphyromonadaceae bacterium]HBL34728.1 hexitol phosphatase HxpB [Porphyromonadaceae bacterium]HBX20935.1 hexitol phosphatase HxpB [Porphyromonadaceae bacterium]HBX46484.1 hexitol phosphatase HxpB [Porphyromonadaceae bacterium]
MVKAIIFDMDGVIIDSEKLWKRAEYEIFSSLGVNVTDSDSELTQTMTTAEVTRFWYSKYPWQNISLREAEQRVVSRVIELIDTEDCRIEGVKSFIEKLKEMGLKVALATNSPSEIIPFVLKKLEITHLFDVISSADLVDKGKPAPDIYYYTARKLAVDPKYCIAIEDSYTGMSAAKTARMTVIAFIRKKKDLPAGIIDFQFDRFDCKNIDEWIKRGFLN